MQQANRGVAYRLGQLFALLLVLLAGYVVYLLLSASDQTRIAVLTAAVSLGTLVYSQMKNTQREIAGRQFAQKSKAYQDVIATIGDMFKAEKGWIEATDTDALAKRLFDIQTDLLIWAGPEVLSAWNDLKNGDGGMETTFRMTERLLRALRRELGHADDDKLGSFGLVRIYLRKEDHDQLPA